MLETLPMNARDYRFELALPEKPSRITFDPWFDLFRQLDIRETPVTLSRLFSAERLMILLPAATPKPLLAAYRQLAERWAGDFPQAHILSDRDLAKLPDDRPILLLGWRNHFLADFARHLPDNGFSYSEHETRLLGERFDTDNHSFALTGESHSSHQPIVWIGSNSADALAGLARKLPHYGKYSALVFSGSAPTNHLKRQWPVSDSPLSINLEKAESKPLTTPPPLVKN